ncbi:hypothetical protein NVV30_19395 [Pseudomonas syringae]|uniref:hypothetical protein n=1 Tax=Pseudomonas syringae TaxID=317 RepID=UPI00215B0BCB|nr:hypothetical protein [Pseudomonas syringae]MCR8720850.1 hypothetical protein [Pseudomonas syringae]
MRASHFRGREALGASFEMLPCGLFADGGARMITPDWARYAWENDQRIAGMTGQKVSELYKEQVLGKERARFNSGAMNRALTEVKALWPALEPVLLNALQTARYVDCRDTCSYLVVADITARLLEREGYQVDASVLSVRLYADEELGRQTLVRTSTSQALIRRFDLRGVPQLLIRSGDVTLPVNSKSLYQGMDALLAEIRATADSAGASATAR